MKKTLDNPFLVSGYESPEYFCDRRSETQSLLEAFQNGRNVTLTSPRRMGKTGLILHTFYSLKQLFPQRPCIYIDLLATESLADFTELLASSVLGQLDSDPMKVMKKAVSLIRGIRPYISVDEFSGLPKIGVEIVKGEEAHTIAQIFEYLNNSGKECYLAFDEFQQIGQYPGINVEALLSSHIQNVHNVHFIFSGSQSHLLSEMFLSPKRPFYQSATHQSIGPIEMDDYYNFASHFFSIQGRMLTEDVFNWIYQRYEGHTWYMQKILNHLYPKKDKEINLGLVMESLGEILKENEFYYQMLLRSYTKGQVKLIKAIAREKKVSAITSGAFVSKYGLTATSSVKSALKRLLNDEIVYQSNDGYMLYDRFMSEWINLYA